MILQFSGILLFEENFERGELGDNLLVSDSGCSLSEYLMTPFLNPVPEEEQIFNETLIRMRNTGERSYGLWKKRFFSLLLPFI